MNLLQKQFVSSLPLPSRTLLKHRFCMFQGRMSVHVTHLPVLHSVLTSFPYRKVSMNVCAPQDVREERGKQGRPLGAERLGWNSGDTEDK